MQANKRRLHNSRRKLLLLRLDVIEAGGEGGVLNCKISIGLGRESITNGAGLGPPALQRSVDSDELTLKSRGLGGFRGIDTGSKLVAARINGSMQSRPCLAQQGARSLRGFAERVQRSRDRSSEVDEECVGARDSSGCSSVGPEVRGRLSDAGGKGAPCRGDGSLRNRVAQALSRSGGHSSGHTPRSPK